MTSTTIKGFAALKDEVRRRVSSREWPPGSFIPNETDLALEFGCSRTTVSRALRELAEIGLLERRRKAGTRVALTPVRKATLSITIIRQEIERSGKEYGYLLLDRQQTEPPVLLQKLWRLDAGVKILNVKSLHLGNARPFALEDRWINTIALPSALGADFEINNSNEWLIKNAPFSHGEISFTSKSSTATESNYLDVADGSSLFVVDRSTWMNDSPITSVRVFYHPGYYMKTTI